MRWKLFLLSLLISGWAWAGGAIEHRVGSGGGSVQFNVGSGGGQVKYTLGLTEPINFAFISASSNTIGNSWTTHDLTPAPTNYSVQLSTNSNFSGNNTSTDTANLTSTTTALLVNRIYYGRVRAIAPVFDPSPWSGVRSSATLAVVPVTVASTWTNVNITSATMNWSASDNPVALTQYQAYLSTASDFSGTLFSSFTYNVNATFTGLTGGGTYYGEVRAINNSNIPTSYFVAGSTVMKPAATVPALVQSSACLTTAAVDTLTCGLNSAATVGNTIVVFAGTQGESLDGALTVDNKGNRYDQRMLSAGSNSEGAIYVSTVIATGGSALTVTVDGLGSPVYSVVVAEFSNVTQYDQQNNATNTGTAVDSGSLTTSVSALWVGLMLLESGASPSITENGTWSLISEAEAAANVDYSAIYKVQNAATDSAKWTIGTSVVWRAGVVTIK